LLTKSERCANLLHDDVSPVNIAKGFTAAHLGAIAATTWFLLLNAVVGFQLLDDGTPISIGLFVASGIVLFVGTGYITLDTAFSWTGHFDSSLHDPNKNIGLYVLYQLFPLICLVAFFALEAILVIRILGERRPLRMYRFHPCARPLFS
jgi:hypothetical protein